MVFTARVALAVHVATGMSTLIHFTKIAAVDPDQTFSHCFRYVNGVDSIVLLTSPRG